MRIEPVKIYHNSNIPKAVKKTVSNPLQKKSLMISSAGASAIAAAAMIKNAPKEITPEDIEKKFTEHGYIKNEYDAYSLQNLSDENLSRIKNKYGKIYSDHIRWKYQMSEFDSDDIKKLNQFLNIDKKTGRKILNENFDDLMDTYMTLTASPVFNLNSKISQNKELYTLITNVITTPFDKNKIESVYNWKGKSHTGVAGTAQSFLREHKTGMPAEAQEFTDNLSKAIDTQKLPESITLYRREGMEVLKTIMAHNDRKINLALVMQEISKMEHPEEELKKLKEFILDNEITAVQPSFMATSIDKDLVNHFEGPKGPDGGDANIIWTFNVAPNTKGLYIEALNADGTAFNEQEVLLQKGTKIKIEDIDYNKFNGMWKIKATVSN